MRSRFRLARRSSFRLALGALAMGGLAAACGGGHTVALPALPTVPTSPSPPTVIPPTTPTTTARAVKTTAAAPTCPLTGLPAPGGRVPPRPALAVKVENLPQARPQYGLSDR